MAKGRFSRPHAAAFTTGWGEEILKNGASVLKWRDAAVSVGPSINTFAYDDLNQLRSATSIYRSRADVGYQTASTFEYDAIGNLTKKL